MVAIHKQEQIFRKNNVFSSLYLIDDLPSRDCGDPKKYFEEYLPSTDGGISWTPVPGPNVTIKTELDNNGYEWEIMTNIPSLFYPLDDGAIPGLY